MTESEKELRQILTINTFIVKFNWKSLLVFLRTPPGKKFTQSWNRFDVAVCSWKKRFKSDLLHICVNTYLLFHFKRKMSLYVCYNNENRHTQTKLRTNVFVTITLTWENIYPQRLSYELIIRFRLCKWEIKCHVWYFSNRNRLPFRIWEFLGVEWWWCW